MAGPALSSGVRVSGLVRLADVAPTVLDLLASPSPLQADGRSLRPVIAGSGSSLQVYGETFYPYLSLGWSPLRSLRTNGFTYVEAPTPELYRPEDDPGELRNLAERLPSQLQSMAARLDSLAGPAVADVSAPSPDVTRKLATLGYLSSGGSGSAWPGRDPKDALPLYNDLLAADVMIRRGSFEQADSLLRSVLDRDPVNRQAMLRLGALLRDSGRLEEAAEVLDRGRTLYPDDYELNLQSGACRQQLGALGEALERYEAALRLFDNDPALFTDLAVVEEQLGDSEAARAAYARSLELDPHDAVAHFNLAMLLVREGGDPAVALAHLDSAMSLDPALAQRPNVARIRSGLLQVTRGGR
jgi:tetratricopeptide (TPR) repeat protein